MTLGGLIGAINDIKRGKKVGMWVDHNGEDTPGPNYTAQINIKRRFVVLPKRCYDSGRWIIGKVYQDMYGFYYHPSEAMARVLNGEYRIVG